MTTPRLPRIPKSWPVQPLKASETATDKATCGTCGVSWDDVKVTSITPAPSARCPFESFHKSEGSAESIVRDHNDAQGLREALEAQASWKMRDGSPCA